MPIGLLARSAIPITRAAVRHRGIPCFHFGSNAKPLMPPTPPPEKKWFYKEVWSALQLSLDKVITRRLSQTISVRSNPPQAAGTSWTQRIANACEQGFTLAERHGLREKLDFAFQLYCRFVTAIKKFFYQKRYHQMGTLMTDGLKNWEERVRSVREGRPLGRDAGNGPAGGKVDGVCVKADALMEEKKIKINMSPKPAEKD